LGLGGVRLTRGTPFDKTLFIHQASEASPALFSISGASANATCKAVENSVPSGYSKNESDSQNGDPVSRSCTIINLPNAPVDDMIMSSGFEYVVFPNQRKSAKMLYSRGDQGRVIIAK